MVHGSAAARPVSAFMTQPAITIDGDAPCAAADERMERCGIRHLPVVEDGRLVGILSRHDLMGSALHQLRVREVMREPVLTVGPGQPASEAARLILDHRVGPSPSWTGRRWWAS